MTDDSQDSLLPSVKQRFLQPGAQYGAEIFDMFGCGETRRVKAGILFGAHELHMNWSGSHEPYAFKYWRTTLDEGPPLAPRDGYDILCAFHMADHVSPVQLLSGRYPLNKDADVRDIMCEFPINLEHTEFLPTPAELGEASLENDAKVVEYNLKRLEVLQEQFPREDRVFFISVNALLYCSEFVNATDRPSMTLWGLHKQENTKTILGQSIYSIFAVLHSKTVAALQQYGSTTRNAFEALNEEEEDEAEPPPPKNYPMEVEEEYFEVGENHLQHVPANNALVEEWYPPGNAQIHVARQAVAVDDDDNEEEDEKEEEEKDDNDDEKEDEEKDHDNEAAEEVMGGGSKVGVHLLSIQPDPEVDPELQLGKTYSVTSLSSLHSGNGKMDVTPVNNLDLEEPWPYP